MSDIAPRSRSKRAFFKAAAALLAAPLVPRPARSASPELFIEETAVAGTAYYDAKAALPRLKAGDPLLLRREPQNPHDTLAIEVFTADGAKLGYMPRVKNAPYARMMDSGRSVSACVAAVRPGHWQDVVMAVAMQV